MKRPMHMWFVLTADGNGIFDKNRYFPLSCPEYFNRFIFITDINKFIFLFPSLWPPSISGHIDIYLLQAHCLKVPMISLFWMNRQTLIMCNVLDGFILNMFLNKSSWLNFLVFIYKLTLPWRLCHGYFELQIHEQMKHVKRKH